MAQVCGGTSFDILAQRKHDTAHRILSRAADLWATHGVDAVNRALLISTLCAALNGCGRPTISVHPPPVTQDWGFNVDGLYVSVPDDPRGKAIYKPNRTDWKLLGATFTAQKQLMARSSF